MSSTAPLASERRPFESEPEVFVVNWDLRRPIFPPLPTGPNLYYSAKMSDLVNNYGPKRPYVVVHWWMEVVDPELLYDCVHALVDVLARMLHDESLSKNLTTVWFPSDYPYPIVK
jgi:hypothetical protein